MMSRVSWYLLLNIWISRLRWQQTIYLLWLTVSIHRRLRFAQWNLRVRWPWNGFWLRLWREWWPYSLLFEVSQLIHFLILIFVLKYNRDSMYSKYTVLSHFHFWSGPYEYVVQIQNIRKNTYIQMRSSLLEPTLALSVYVDDKLVTNQRKIWPKMSW